MELLNLRKILYQTNLGIMNSPGLKDHEKGTMMLEDVSVVGILKNEKKQKRKTRKTKHKINVNEEFLNESIRDLELSCEVCDMLSCEGCMMNPYLALEA